MKNSSRLVVWGAALLASLAILSCSNTNNNGSTDANATNETGQQIGDSMASIDAGASGGGVRAEEEGGRRLFARLSPEEVVTSVDDASRAICTEATGGVTVAPCTSSQVVLTFNSCTIGLAVVAGTTTFSFSKNDCTVPVGESVKRNPAFTVTGRFGGVYAVTKTGSDGQKFSRDGVNTGKFSNDGIRRTFTKSGESTPKVDFTTSTTSDITVTGIARAGRTINGGTLHVVNNLTGVSCDVTPSSVTWGATCNCPTAGTWTGTCSNGKSVSVEFTSACGTANVTADGATETVTLDRCIGL